ncbi:MAG: hypothetical protein ACK4U0_01345 [Mesorhizobium sp.]
MNEDVRQPVLYFVHVPKCAGRTIESHLRRHLPEAALVRPDRAAPLRRYLTGKSWRAPRPEQPRDVRAVTGHYFGASIARWLPEHRAYEAILLRDPVGLFLSWYNFRMMRYENKKLHVPSFEAWYEGREQNPVARHLFTTYLGWSVPRFLATDKTTLMAHATKALDRFWFVGSYRHADALVAAIAEILPVPPQAEYRNRTDYRFRDRASLDEALVARITGENDLDIALLERYENRGLDREKAVPARKPSPGRLLGAELRRAASHLNRSRRDEHGGR